MGARKLFALQEVVENDRARIQRCSERPREPHPFSAFLYIYRFHRGTEETFEFPETTTRFIFCSFPSRWCCFGKGCTVREDEFKRTRNILIMFIKKVVGVMKRLVIIEIYTSVRLGYATSSGYWVKRM